MKRSALLLLLALAACRDPAPTRTLRVASKSFTESVVLGEMVSLLARSTGATSEHRRALGGTRLLWDALLAGQIDIYPEYTGTLALEILRVPDLQGALAAQGLAMSAPLGFNNTYALGMREDVASRLGITTISDLARHPSLRFGFSNEFLDRGDGWPALRARYGLAQDDVRGLDHDVAYRALAGGGIDVVDLYATDPEIAYQKLRVLRDDRQLFPRYDAVLLYRRDAEQRLPPVFQALSRLASTLSEVTMARLNGRVKLGRETEEAVAASFLADRLAVTAHLGDGRGGRLSSIARRTGEHLTLVSISLFFAILVAVPLGVLAARRPRLGQVVLAATGVLQTIPSLALLVFMVPLLGIGAVPAIMALFLYSLLPIVRNTHAGLLGIAPPVRDAAAALGLGPRAMLRLVELPLASPSILAGIKSAAVINVGTATLGALVGAGGFGQPILTGVRLDDVGLILEGAIPASLLAIAVQAAFDLAERLLVPAGLRLRQEA